MKMMNVIILVLGLCTSTVKAIPSWIGVYGDEQRHAAGNPGTYTILMNQSYPGLRAAVTARVVDSIDAGKTWIAAPMEKWTSIGNTNGGLDYRVAP